MTLPISLNHWEIFGVISLLCIALVAISSVRTGDASDRDLFD